MAGLPDDDEREYLIPFMSILTMMVDVAWEKGRCVRVLLEGECRSSQYLQLCYAPQLTHPGIRGANYVQGSRPEYSNTIQAATKVQANIG